MADEALVRSIVAAATRAPSVHNTQPWHFVARDDVVELWTDRSRGLPVVDPDGRARLLSCGAGPRAGAHRGGRPRYGDDAGRRRPRVPTPTTSPTCGWTGPDRPTTMRAHSLPRSASGTPSAAPSTTPRRCRGTSSAAGRGSASRGCWLRVVDSADDTAAVTVLLGPRRRPAVGRPGVPRRAAAVDGPRRRQPRRPAGLRASRPRHPPTAARATAYGTSTPTAPVGSLHGSAGAAALPSTRWSWCLGRRRATTLRLAGGGAGLAGAGCSSPPRCMACVASPMTQCTRNHRHPCPGAEPPSSASSASGRWRRVGRAARSDPTGGHLDVRSTTSRPRILSGGRAPARRPRCRRRPDP